MLDIARELGMPILESPPLLDKSFYKDLPYSWVRKHMTLPLAYQEGSLLVGLSNPLNIQGLEELFFFNKENFIPVYVPEESLIKAIELCYHQESGHTEQVIASLDMAPAESALFETDDLLEDNDEAPVIQLLNAILSEAFLCKASDIHFEPAENDLKIRFRIDGLLKPRFSPPKEIQKPLVTRIKVMARLDIAQQRLPQDGRIKIKMGARHIDLRVSTLPVAGGERLVLRILDKSSVLLNLESLGMQEPLFSSFKELLHYPEGMILVTGPTGSGKTTTLYSALGCLDSLSHNIMTIEDPIEYKIAGIAQMAVNTKIQLTFASGLRHILRQDPDVILVGEIRDSETASIAIQSALTGHLVLSTLHTNDAPSAIPRLVDMGIEPYLLSSALIGVLAQRLVRRLCSACKTLTPLTSFDKTFLGFKTEALYRPVGCPACQGMGFKGRIALYEFMALSPTLRECLSNSLSSKDIHKIAVSEGMIPLRQSGITCILQGLTTVEEVLQATRN